MKKGLFTLAIVFSLIMITGVIAETTSFSKETEENLEEVIQKKGIDKENILSIEKLNFEDLPEEISIENLDQTNLAMYKVYSKNSDKPFYILTASDEMLVGASEKEVINKMLLNYGLPGKSSESQFLNSATGVKGTEEKGYVMMRKGTINGISTNLEILKGEGEIEIIIYKNGLEIGFRNIINANELGIKKDYDVQTGKTIEFEPGDIISIYLQVNGDLTYQDVNTLLEISTIE